jgi:UDP-glucose 4-epimerase
VAQDRTVLVTGGAGYIGSHTVRALVAAGRPVVVVDSLELGRSDAVGPVDLVVGDIADTDLIGQICADYQVGSVVHFAAYKNVGESMNDPAKYLRNNLTGTINLLEAVQGAGVSEIVFSSSCSVYGTPEMVPVDESAAIAPESVYAQTKATMENLLDWYSKTLGVRSVSLRYFNAAGASTDGLIGEDWTSSLNLVPVAIRCLLTGNPVELNVFGDDYPTADGTCIRDYIHVEDLALAHIRALEYLAAAGPTTAVNVGTGTGSSVYEVLTAIEKVAGRPVPYRIGPRRAGDPVATYADPRMAREVLNWQATKGLDEVVGSAYRWHLSQLPNPELRDPSAL